MKNYRVLIAVAFAAMTAAAPSSTGSVAPAVANVLAVTGAKIYSAPDEPPIANGVVVMRAGKIVAVGKAGAVAVPDGAKVIDGAGLVVTAGFQNSHVHFIGSGWQSIATQPAPQLRQQVAAMLTRYGVTTAVDIASSLPNTSALRERIEKREVAGPRVLTAGAPLYPEDGLPFYMKNLNIPPEVLRALPQPKTTAEAAAAVQRNVAGGADVIKLFTGSLIAQREVKPMRVHIARAAVDEAHRNHRLVFTHPSNTEGIQVAITAGVDILAHTTPDGGSWDAELVKTLVQHHVAVIPTLKLWPFDLGRESVPAQIIARFNEVAAQQLKAFADIGGQVLFGTDVGYMTDYDPTDEYVLMARAGLSWKQILASLTTTPAERFGESARRGRVAAGMDADLVVLGGDPLDDVRNFASVHYTIRGGRVIYPLP